MSPAAPEESLLGTAPHGALQRDGFSILSRFAERLLALGLLLFFTEAVRSVLVNPGGQGSTVLVDDPVRAPVQMLIFALTFALLISRWRESLDAMRAAWPFWLLSGIALISTAWSIDRAHSLRYGLWLTATAVLGMHFDLRFDPRTQLRLLATVLGLVIVISVCFILWYPSLGLEPSLHWGAWRGAFIHKNSLGRAMALAALVFALLIPTSRRSIPFLATALATAVVLGWYSRSATAPVLLLLLGSLLPLRWVLRRRGLPVPALVLTGIGLVAGAVWFISENLEAILAAFGRDASLSGRPLLWASLVPEILDRPLLGSGLDAFWKGSSGAAAGVEKLVGWNPGQAHNGFIDAAVDLGFVGFAVLILALGYASAKALVYARARGASSVSLWPIGYFAFFAMSNMTESSILRANTIFWFLLAAVSTRAMRAPDRQPT
jgi:O-antigen ligase